MQVLVDGCRLRNNVRRIRAKLNTGFCAVVKSQAYGHGFAASCFLESVVDCFFVANFDEACELIYSGVKKPIYVLGCDISPFLKIKSDSIIPTAYSARSLDSLIQAGYKNISISVDTGMNRLGAGYNELAQMTRICKDNNIVPTSVYSHIYNGVRSAYEQAERFEWLTTDPLLRRNRHLYSSVALELSDFDTFDMVRCGIAMYGFWDGGELALSARAKILSIFRVEKGSHIGYGEFTADKDMTVATVRCGYSDGLRHSTKPVFFTVRGKKCKVLGQPCMDLTMIDISNVPCRVGEFAYFIQNKNDVYALANAYDTIVYEVLVGLNGRAERIYI